jgi:aerotolerance regulator-like protein
MSFLAPGFLIAAAGVALVVAGLHFLSTRSPNLDLLPTARFLPDLPVQATAITLHLRDLLLLLLRVLIVVLVGAGLAKPLLTPARHRIARIVAVDVSRAVHDSVEVEINPRTYARDAAVLIVFDSAARVVNNSARDSIQRSAARGSLSAALIVAQRAAARIRDRADSIELVVVSPFLAEEQDAATQGIRKLWPGRITTVPVAASVQREHHDSIRVAWADSGPSTWWQARASIDTVSGIRAGDVVLVYPFARRWRQVVDDTSAYAIARWADGEPAALEHITESGCERSYGFSLPSEGDVLLRSEFQRFVTGLGAQCGKPRDFTPLAAAALDSIRGAGRLAPTSLIPRHHEATTTLTRWFLLAAMCLALVEMFVRRGRIYGAQPAAADALPGRAA